MKYAHSCFLFTLILIALPRFAAGNANQGQSFTPTSVLVPIDSIGLIDPSSGANIGVYKCAAGTVAGCTVDLANKASIAAAFATSQSASVTAATYQQIYINNCPGGVSSYTLQMEGNVSLGGSVLYTTPAATSTADMVTTTQANLGYSNSTVTQCQTTYPIPGGLNVTVGSTLSVSLLVDVANLGAVLNGTTSNMGANCTSGTNYTFCYSIPVMVPYLGSTSPTTETYRLTDSSDNVGTKGYAELEFFINPSGASLIGVASRLVYESGTYLGGGGSTPSPVAQPSGSNCNGQACNWKISPFVDAFKNFSLNGDGTYSLISFGGPTSSTTPADTTGSYVVMLSFGRIAAVGGTPTTGTMTSPLAYFDPNMTNTALPVTYQALRTQ